MDLEIIEPKAKRYIYLLKVAFIVAILPFLASCGSTKNLQLDQFALVKNRFILNTSDKRVDKSKIVDDIKGLIKQTPVRKNVLNPRTYGTPLTIYDRVATEESLDAVVKYLRNRRGFYHAHASFDEKYDGRKVEVTYTINLEQRYYIGSVEIEARDTSLLRLFQSHQSDSKLQAGEPLDSRVFDEEEIRLITLAKNNGYANFSRTFVEFRGDSSQVNVPVKIFIYSPLDTSDHQKFHIGEVNVYTEHIPSANPAFSSIDTLKFQNYFAGDTTFMVGARALEQSISVKSGDLYSRENEFLTNRKLSRLSPYRFVNIRSSVSPLSDTLYDYNIFLTPHDNKWVFDMGANLFYSLLGPTSISERDLFGVAGNIGFENRNFKRRAISHRFGLEGTFEFQIPTFTPNTISIQANNSFNIPRVVDPWKMSKFFNAIGLLTDRSYNNLNLFTNTEIDFSLGITDIINAYSLNTLNASWAFNFQPDEYNRYIYTQMGINVLDTNIDPIFQQEILDQNRLIDLSFKDYLFTGFLIKELNIFKRTKENLSGNYFAFLVDFEMSGFENWVMNRLVNAVSNYNDRWKLAGLEFSEFLRFNADVRFYQKVTERSNFAARLNAAIAIPYGDDEVVPFVKSFFVGGPNSLRGWQLRELGPGSYSNQILNPIMNQPFFQVGDFKLELNAEYRFDLFWFWEGALFVDAGNVWTLKNDIERPGSKLTSSFLNELAISAGWGLRADFDYFILRLDFGYKLRSPFVFPDTNTRWIFNENGVLGNVNFAINYPF